MQDEVTAHQRLGFAVYRGAGFWHRAGTLVLYPDKLAHVGSVLATTGGGGGLLGVLIARSVAQSQAVKKVAKAHKRVTSIPLAEIASVEPVVTKRRKTRGILVKTLSGQEYQFMPAKAEEWLVDLNQMVGQRTLRSE